MKSFNIGVYGDSFVATANNDFKKTIDAQSWTYLLKQKYNHFVANYGYAGTGIDYSYYHFINTHSAHDKVIFVAANIFRGTTFSIKNQFQLHSPIEDQIKNIKVSGIYGLYGHKKGVTDHVNGNVTTQISKNYINSKFEDWAENEYSNELLKYYSMISHIKLIRPDVYFIYAFNTFSTNCFYNISMLDMEKFGTFKETTSRTNHMSVEQNKQVAKYMNDWVQDKFDFTETLNPAQISKYYTVSNTVQESGLEY